MHLNLYSKSIVIRLFASLLIATTTRADETKINSANLAGAGYLLAERSDLKLNLSDPTDWKLSEILDRNGPDFRAAFDNRDHSDISLEISKRAWQLLHEHAEKAIADRIDAAQPALEQMLLEAKASDRCLRSVQEVFRGAERMEAWALRLINSWGDFPPAGVFEGTYNDPGSYHVCTNVPQNQYIGHAHYCAIFLRPVLPSKRDYELVFTRKPKELLEMFDKNKEASGNLKSERDALGDLLEHAHYHHYVYYKWGTCWPIGCSPFDVRRVVKRLARGNMLLTGPIKCYSNFEDDYLEPDSADNKTQLIHAFDNLNDDLYIIKPYFVFGQKVAVAFIGGLMLLLIMATFIDLVHLRGPSIYNFLKLVWSSSIPTNEESNTKYSSTTSAEINQSSSVGATAKLKQSLMRSKSNQEGEKKDKSEQPTYSTSNWFLSLVDDLSIISNCSRFATITQGQLKNDILCLYGIRWTTMCWIILCHTMQYNDWGQFGRSREIEKSIDSKVTAPIFNGSYQVDTFFLLSGLLTAFGVFKQTKGVATRFKLIPYVLGRWLRLTPQVLMTIIGFIVLPLLSTGPHWYQATGQYSENCRKHWWINMLHLQVFYKTDQMCVFPSWWVSLDFFYHLLALVVIYALLIGGHKLGFGTMLALVVSLVTKQALKHYSLGLPANIFSTIPLTGKMWQEFTLGFYWQPYSHSVPFFSGFYLGYLMSMRGDMLKNWFTPRRALIGWSLTAIALIFESYSTYWWLVGRVTPSQFQMTIANVGLPIIWSLVHCWVITACHYGYGGSLNRFLSSKTFIRLSKASYMVYLFHFQIIFYVYGSKNMLMEPTPNTMISLSLVMIFFTSLYGILLCILIDLPWLRIAKKIMRKF